jgi:hypothetical protein
MNNPPAFPTNIHNYGDGKYGSQGMTLRDYFAAKAMQGLLAGLLAYGHDIMWDEVAKDAYRQADAMLAAREKA